MAKDHDARDADAHKPDVHKPKRSAAGIPAIAHTMQHALTQMGPVQTVRSLGALNQVDGFDCMSCAWPDPGHRSHAEFCENGAKAVAWEATKHRVTAEFFAEHSVADLRQRDDHWLESQGRLTQPMHLAPGDTHYRPIEWDQAFDLIATKLRQLASPDRAVFYTSGRASNEAAFVYQLLVRRLGTNNLPDCSNMCHESSGVALTQTLGIGKGTVSLADITDHADLIVIVGQNPGTNHPRMLTALETAKRRGAKIVAINPLPEAGLIKFRNPKTPRGLTGNGTRLADRFLSVRVGGDLAFFNAVNARLVECGAIDHDFLDRYCDGFPAAREAWSSSDQIALASQAGVAVSDIEEFVGDVRSSQRVIVCWAMGLTQQPHAVATIREIVNFLLLRGNFGRAGAGACPVRGHSNVQGDRTMGIYEKPSAEFLDALAAEFAFAPPQNHGYDTVDAIRAMRDGAVDVFFALGGNFAAATPDTAVTVAAMRNCALTVQVSTKLNRSHLHPGLEALILPCLGRTERDIQGGVEQQVTVEDSMSMVHASRGRLDPASPELRSEVSIVTGVAHALFGEDLGWQAMGRDYRVIRQHIARVIPGFESFEQRLTAPGGFLLPNGPRDNRTFTTSNGKAHLTVNPPVSVDVPPGHLLLQTVRSHDQFNTTVYGLDDRYRGIKNGRRVVFVAADDIQALGFADGDLVDLISIWPDGQRRAPRFRIVAYPTPLGCAAAYFPETNVLVPLDSVAEQSNTPTSKSIIIRLEAHK